MKKPSQPKKRKSAPAETLDRFLCLSSKLMGPLSAYLEHQHGISVNEFRVLMLTGRMGETASHEVAHETGLNIMSISRAVATLVRGGRISVTRDPANRRRKVLRLTKEGKRLHEIMSAQTSEAADNLLSNLGEENVLILDQFLEAMINTLDAVDAEGRSVFMKRARPS